MIPPDPDLSRRRPTRFWQGRPRRVTAALAALAGLSLTGAGAHLLRAAEHPAPVGATAAVRAPVVEVVTGSAASGVAPVGSGAPHHPANLVGAASTVVPWAAPLALTVSSGTFTQVVATDADGSDVSGVIERSSRREGRTDQGAGWRSTAAHLLPGMTYHLTATTVDAVGRSSTHSLTAAAARATHYLHAVISPADDAVVGVGLPVIVTLDREVDGPVARAAVQARLTVTSRPAVAGAWRWMNASELHYRGPAYWASGTQLTTTVDLRRLELPDGTWGEDTHTSSWSVGRAFVSTVDNATNLMTSTVDGKVVRVMKDSLGRPGYDTRSGVHLVLEKQASLVMDSATTGHAIGDKDYYKETVLWTVRLSYAGTFVHSAPWSVQDQGLRNVSHGCINLSPEDAEWFYGQALRGDIVNIVNTGVGPVRSDPGMSDWNYTFAAWKQP